MNLKVEESRVYSPAASKQRLLEGWDIRRDTPDLGRPSESSFRRNLDIKKIPIVKDCETIRVIIIIIVRL